MKNENEQKTKNPKIQNNEITKKGLQYKRQNDAH